MLDSFKIRPYIHARLLLSPLAPYLDDFVEVLRGEGYAPSAIRRYVHAADAFGSWLSRRRIAARAVEEATVARFIVGIGRYPTRSRPRGRLSEVASGARKFAEFLWRQGVATRCSDVSPPTEAEQWLRSFDHHLDHVCGLSAGTRHIYLYYATKFVTRLFGIKALDWSVVTADDIEDFVRIQAARLRPSASRAPVTATRAMLRYLTSVGAVRAGLGMAVPTVRQWKLGALPRYLKADEVERVIIQCGGATAVRRRDRAILLLLARLGLRAGEVSRLALDDIDWREGQVLIRYSKSKRERILPLSKEVGEALVGYLRSGRPDGFCRTIFLRSRPPHRPLKASSITTIAQNSLRRAGIVSARSGAHTLRHTAATQMVQRGVSFKEVADVLGHARLETTAVYAKLDLDALARVAMPWPGGAQ